MKILGLDVGDVRIGVAVSDHLGIIASPYSVINRKEQKAIKIIKEIINENKIKKLVVGLPKSLDGTEKVQAEKVRDFVKKLNSKLQDVEIIYIDERYSTVSADNVLQKMGKKGAKNKRKVVDKVAATIILQNYLDIKRDRI